MYNHASQQNEGRTSHIKHQTGFWRIQIFGWIESIPTKKVYKLVEVLDAIAVFPRYKLLYEQALQHQSKAWTLEHLLEHLLFFSILQLQLEPSMGQSRFFICTLRAGGGGMEISSLHQQLSAISLLKDQITPWKSQLRCEDSCPLQRQIWNEWNELSNNNRKSGSKEQSINGQKHRDVMSCSEMSVSNRGTLWFRIWDFPHFPWPFT